MYMSYIYVCSMYMYVYIYKFRWLKALCHASVDRMAGACDLYPSHKQLRATSFHQPARTSFGKQRRNEKGQTRRSPAVTTEASGKLMLVRGCYCSDYCFVGIVLVTPLPLLMLPRACWYRCFCLWVLFLVMLWLMMLPCGS